MIKSKKQMFIVIGAFTLVMLLVGTTYAFFNYTRTGAQNTVGTGSIYFLATESNERINITNFFPTATGAQADSSNSDSMTIAIEAGTSYQYGIDYSLKAVNVSIPSGVNIPVKVTTSAVNDTGKDIGFTGVTGVTLANDVSLGTGHIEPSTDGGLSGNRETGTITVTAYIDAANVAISDTYDENNPGSAANGTTSEWVNGRRVITTSEWNALASNPITFKVKVEAGEGSAQEAPVAQATCPGPGCQYMLAYDETYNYGANGTLVDDIVDAVSNDYNDIMMDEHPYFVGFTTANGRIDKAYACGVFIPADYDFTYDDYYSDDVTITPFCIEGTSDSTRKSDLASYNSQYLYSLFGTAQGYSDRNGCMGSVSFTNCKHNAPTVIDTVFATSEDDGSVIVGLSGNNGYCEIRDNSEIYCE